MTGRQTSRHITSTLALSTALAVLCALGCGSSKRIAKTNDALRIQREDLRERVATLEGENAELHVKIAELMQNEDAELSEDVLAAMPRVASIELTRHCHIEETDNGPVAVLFIRTLDGRGRFVQAVGHLFVSVINSPGSHKTIEVNILGEQSGPLGSDMLDTSDLRDAYTSGITGTAYMVRVPLTQTDYDRVSFAAGFEDALTGEFFDTIR